jgi:hypothetical protein
MNNIERITLLRTQIPIGINYASRLLAQVDGDIERAILHFKNHAVEAIVQRTDLTSAQALSLLEQHQFEINETLKFIESSQYSVTERILTKQHKDKAAALDTLLFAVIEHHQLKINYGFTKRQLDSLSHAEYTFAIILDWLNYCEWEGFYSALYHTHFTDVINEIENTLSYPEFAQSLRSAQSRMFKLKVNHLMSNDIDDYITFNNHIVIVDKVMTAALAFFENHHSQLIACLHAFIKENIKLFP